MINVNDQIYTGPMTISQTVEQFEFRILVHEYYAVLVVQDTRYLNYGSNRFHLWAINGYKEAIRHMTTKKWYTSKTIWANLLMAAGIVVNATVGEDILSPEVQGAIVVIVNMVLRLVTGSALTK